MMVAGGRGVARDVIFGGLPGGFPQSFPRYVNQPQAAPPGSGSQSPHSGSVMKPFGNPFAGAFPGSGVSAPHRIPLQYEQGGSRAPLNSAYAMGQWNGIPTTRYTQNGGMAGGNVSNYFMNALSRLGNGMGRGMVRY